ncbi:MAG: hypothetical protein K6E63_10530 [Lachnospiraceae bacterium]|nr:hypothetical protein [Lachnospiraceae bacterium]
MFDLVLVFCTAVLAPVGAYTVMIWAVQSFKGTTFDHAREYVNEVIKDLVHHRDAFQLERSNFPTYLKNDISAYLSSDEFERWVKRYRMMSQKSEASGYTSENLPYYAFTLLFVSEDSESIYESMIKNIGEEVLRLGNCTDCRLILRWFTTDDTSFHVCMAVYARTAKEQETFAQLLKIADKKTVPESENVVDPELENSLNSFKKGG